MVGVRSIFVGMVACAFAVGLNSSSNSATITGPAPEFRTFSVITIPDSSPLTSGTGNINGSGDAINLLGYTTLDKSDVGGFVFDGALTINELVEGSGTFSIGPTPGYTNLVLALKGGNDATPSWAAFLLADISGFWSITELDKKGELKFKGLSHANLYGLVDRDPGPSPVPIPGAFLLMGTVLAGSSGVMGWRRRRARGAAQKA